MTRRTLLLLPIVGATLITGVLGLSAQSPSSEPVDLDAITRIKAEGLERSQVMDTAWWLTEVYGPRLTNSPQLRAAADWTVKKLNEWGLANVKQEPWGPNSEFGRGWSNERTVVLVTRPSPWPVLAYAEGVDTGHQRRGHRGRRTGADGERGGLRQVPRQAEGQDRPAAGRPSRRSALRSAGAPIHQREPRRHGDAGRRSGGRGGRGGGPGGGQQVDGQDETRS